MNNFFENKTLIAIDFETSDYVPNSACAIGMVKIFNGEIIDEFYSLIKPPSSKIYFYHIHGLTWSILKRYKTFSDQWSNIESFIHNSFAFVAHNASFDKRILNGTCEHYGITAPTIQFYCTLKGSRKNLKLKSNSLQNVCNHLNIGLNHHNALSDALASAQIFMHFYKQNFELTPLI